MFTRMIGRAFLFTIHLPHHSRNNTASVELTLSSYDRKQVFDNIFQLSKAIYFKLNDSQTFPLRNVFFRSITGINKNVPKSVT